MCANQNRQTSCESSEQNHVKSLHLVLKLEFHRRPWLAAPPEAIFIFFSLKVVSCSSEVCPASCVSPLVLVSHGGAPADSWGIWTTRGPHCPACRSPCRWPSSRTGPRPSQPRWRWRTLGGSPEPPPGTDREPDRQRNARKTEIVNKTEEEHSPSAPFPLLHFYDFKLKIRNCDTSVWPHFVVCLGPGYSVLECESGVIWLKCSSLSLHFSIDGSLDLLWVRPSWQKRNFNFVYLGKRLMLKH